MRPLLQSFLIGLLLIRVEKTAGNGRLFILITEEGSDTAFAEHAFEALSARSKCALLTCSRIDEQNWTTLVDELSAQLVQLKARQASFITFSSSCALVQALALREPKIVRTIVFVNGLTRAHPSTFSRLVDRIERVLPLGLPLRLHESGFDAKPFLQRIRCPVLVVLTNSATHFERMEAQVLARGLPTAWELSANSNDPQGFAGLVTAFQDVPAKCPQ